MKKQSIQIVAKKLFLGNLLAATLFLSANAATPASNNKPAYMVDANKVEVKYLGLDRFNQLSFKVKYSNPTGSTFSLSVLDETGEQVFKAYYGDKQFDKTFKLPKSEVSKLTFVIENGKESLKEKFDVSVITNVSEEVTVSKG